MEKKSEKITLDLLKRINEQVLRLRFASKFHLVYKTLIALFLNRAVLDPEPFILLSVKELNKTKNELIEQVDWLGAGAEVGRFNSEINMLFHEFIKLSSCFCVDSEFEDKAELDEIWLELRRAHDDLLVKEFGKQKIS